MCDNFLDNSSYINKFGNTVLVLKSTKIPVLVTSLKCCELTTFGRKVSELTIFPTPFFFFLHNSLENVLVG